MAKNNELKIVITGDTKKLQGALTSAEGSVSGFGSKFASLGPVVAAAGVAAVAAVGAVGVAAYKLGADFDDAYDTIRVGTGATGKALDALKDSFREVVQDVPTDFGSASTAIADVNTRLGLTGKPLTDFTKRILELSRITKTDLAGNIELTTRLMGDWSVKTKDQSTTLDKLYRASQATGVGVDTLASQVTSFGAPLRGLGFGLDESIALLGKWGKEGVNVENVLGAMKKGYGSFSKEFGEKAPQEFRAFIDEISKAPSAAAAASIAIEQLGVRNGPDFAAAVSEGRFALGDLLTTVTGGKDTILGAAKDTEDFSEKWIKFKNQILVAIEPALTKVFNAAGLFMDWVQAEGIPLMKEWGTIIAAKLQPVLDKLQTFWREHGATVITIAKAIGAALWVMFQVQIQVWQGIITVMGKVITAIQFLYDGYKLLFAQFFNMGVSAFVWVTNAAGSFVNFMVSIPGRMRGLFDGMFDGLKNAFRSAINWVIDKWNGLAFSVPKVDMGFLGSFGGQRIGVPKIPRLAEGGIVTGPTLALIGDNRSGREAVVPLEKAGGMGFGGGSATFNITVNAGVGDPAEIGRQVVESIRRYESRNGSSWRAA